jgi:hypothetical protein
MLTTGIEPFNFTPMPFETEAGSEPSSCVNECMMVLRVFEGLSFQDKSIDEARA